MISSRFPGYPHRILISISFTHVPHMLHDVRAVTGAWRSSIRRQRDGRCLEPTFRIISLPGLHQLAPEHGEALVESGLDGAQRATHEIGNFLERQPVVFLQYDRRALFLREARHGLLD